MIAKKFKKDARVFFVLVCIFGWEWGGVEATFSLSNRKDPTGFGDIQHKSYQATKLPIVYALSFTVIFYPSRLQFRFVHHQAAMIVALRHAVDFLLVRAATTPSIIAEPSHMDEKILHVMKSLSRANAGWFGVNRGGGNQFHHRGHPPG